MARKPKSTTGAATSAGVSDPAVTTQALEAARQQPELMAAVTTLQPYTTAALELVQSVQVTDERSRVTMADLLRTVKSAQSAVDDKFDPITRPLWAAWQAAVKWRGEVRGPLELAERLAKDRIGGYEVECRRVQREQDAAAERAEREQAAQAQVQAQAQAMRTASPFLPSAGWEAFPPPPAEWAPWSGAVVDPAYTGPVYPAPMPAPNTPGIWANPTAQAQAPAKLAGVSTAVSWSVVVDDEPQALAALLSTGMWDLSALGVPYPLLRLDLSAMQLAVRAGGTAGWPVEDATAETIRAILGQIPGLRVVEVAAVRATGY